MPTRNNPNEGFDLGGFRHAAAALCKFLIRARWKVDKKFLTARELRRWGLEKIDHDRGSVAYLLHQSLQAIAEINRTFLDRCGSGGLAVEDESPLLDFKSDVAFLVDYLFALPNAIVQARNDRTHEIAWAELARWDTLPRIRDILDELPHPAFGSSKQARKRSGRITCDQASLTITVDGRRLQVADPTAFRYFEYLESKSGENVKGKELEALPGCKGKRPSGYLKRLPARLQKLVHSVRGRGYCLVQS